MIGGVELLSSAPKSIRSPTFWGSTDKDVVCDAVARLPTGAIPVSTPVVVLVGCVVVVGTVVVVVVVVVVGAIVVVVVGWVVVVVGAIVVELQLTT